MEKEITNNEEQEKVATNNEPVEKTSGEQDVKPFKVFETEEEYNKETQSTSSKGKYQLLQELGVKNLDEVKTKFSELETAKAVADGVKDIQGAFNELGIKNVDDIKTKFSELTLANIELKKTEGLKSELSKLTKEKTELDEKLVLIKHNVNNDVSNEALTLAKSKLEAFDGDLEKALEDVISKFPSMVSTGKDTIKKQIRIGNEKQIDNLKVVNKDVTDLKKKYPHLKNLI